MKEKIEEVLENLSCSEVDSMIIYSLPTNLEELHEMGLEECEKIIEDCRSNIKSTLNRLEDEIAIYEDALADINRFTRFAAQVLI